AAEPAPLRVVASFTILADLVREVGGPLVQVTSLVGPNGDAHVFEPRPADLKNVAAAELLVLNGLQFDRWAERLTRAAEFRGRLLVVSDGIAARRNGLNIDPHAWHDLRLLQTYVTNIADALVALRPAAAAEFRRRAADYRQRLAALDQEIRTLLQAIPAERRRIMTTHDAFGYLGAAYGIEFLAPQGWSTESEPSAAQVANLIRQLRQHKVSALFLENISNPRLIERIAAEGGAKVGGTLYSDALSAPGSAVDSMLKLARHNAVTLAAGMRL
ncbi:MAG: metal ABC transporter solute-binding protein, Zn/Mn family, partial [Leptothrix sp. (in: b-proteobacteria)]